MKGIICSGPMVRALLAGKKTSTCRLAHPNQPCRYIAGEVVYVKESYVKLDPHHRPPDFYYKADYPNPDSESEECRKSLGYKWMSPLLMPESASRIKLKIVRTERARLHSIGGFGVLHEGIGDMSCHCHICMRGTRYMCAERNDRLIQAFSQAWDTINGKKCPWKTNPLVDFIFFERLED